MNLEWKTLEAKLIQNLDASLAWMEQEFKKIRAGAANPAMVESIRVEAYGSVSKLHELANIQVPEPRVLMIKPYDPSIVNDILKGINKSNDSLNPTVDGKLIRIMIPAPTEESRKKSLKLVKEFLEKTKISIRNFRKEIQSTIKQAKLQESLEYSYLENLDKLIKKYNDLAEMAYKQKEKNLMTI